jgi:hypothetical protein
MFLLILFYRQDHYYPELTCNPSASRIKSSNGCVYRLNVPVSPVEYSSSFMDCAYPCSTSASDVNFYAEIIPATSCGDSPKIILWMSADDPTNAAITINGLELGVEVMMNGSLDWTTAIPNEVLTCTPDPFDPSSCDLKNEKVSNSKYFYSFYHKQNSFGYGTPIAIEFPLSGVGCISVKPEFITLFLHSLMILDVFQRY